MTPYEEGQQAVWDYKEFWENPYSGIESSKESFHAWFAGWCDMKKVLGS